ncbi:MAG: hypothetical protein R2882_05505 [Gemmatimonadales bacterium]
MVPDLEQIDPAYGGGQVRFRRQPGIPRKHRPEIAGLHQQHGGILVEVLAVPGPARPGMHDPHHHPVQLEPGPAPNRHPGNVPVGEVVQQLAISPVGHRQRGIEHPVHRKGAEYGAQAAEVIPVAMGKQYPGEPAGPKPSEVGGDHLTARVPAPVRRAGVDQEPMAVLGFEQDRIPLPDIEKM